jgi:C1A family cysteine protease
MSLVIPRPGTDPETGHYALGWNAPLPGRRAVDLLPQADVSGLVAKDEVDPRGISGGNMQEIDDQGQLGDCTADATCGVFRYDAIQDGTDPGPLSRLWVYRFERKLEGTFARGDCGAIGHDAFTVATHGIPSESLWPYDISTFQDAPPAAAVATRAYTLTKPVHTPAQDVDTFKAVLSNGQTIAYGFTVYESYEQTGPDGIVGPPEGDVMGGHEQRIVGYLKAFPDYALVAGSWGTSFALGGYVLFPWEQLMDPNFATDFRTIVRPAPAS